MNPTSLPEHDDEDSFQLPVRQKNSHSNAENDLPYDCYTTAWQYSALPEIVPATGDASSMLTSSSATAKVREANLSFTAGQANPLRHREQLMKSLEFDQIYSRKTTIGTAALKTCSWFLEHPDYLTWLNPEKRPQHHGFLWIRGKPGAGKSIIMKFIYREMKRTDIPMEALTVSFFFNAGGDLLEKSVSGMYRSLLLQLLEGFPGLQRVLDDRCLIPRNKVTCPPLKILKDLFRSAILSLGQRTLTCFVDALDECDEQQVEDMVEFFEEVAEQCGQDSVKFQVCFSSRHHLNVDIKTAIRLTLEDQKGHYNDLEQYITKRLRIQDTALNDEVKKMMLKKAAGVFSHVTLLVNIANTENTRGRLALQTKLEEALNGIARETQQALIE